MLKLVKYHPQFAYSVGDVFEVSESDSKYLLENEFAVETAAPAPEQGTVEAPETGEAAPAPEFAGKKGGRK
jgi:hypothetical protein